MNFSNQSTPATTEDANISTANVCGSSKTSMECAEKRLWQIIAPVIIVIGLLGNLMVIIVFSRLRFSKSSTLVHMFILAIADSVILTVGPMRHWIIHTFNYDVRVFSNVGCKIHLFVLYTSLDFSAWILVSVTVERFLSIVKPFHARRWFTVRRTLYRLAVIFALLCCLQAHYFVSNGLVAKPVENSSQVNVSVCASCKATGANGSSSLRVAASKVKAEYSCDSVSDAWEYFEEYQFVYVDLCFDSAIPFVTMALCNGIIVAYLREASKHRPRNTTRRELDKAKAKASRTASDPLSDAPHDQKHQVLYGDQPRTHRRTSSLQGVGPGSTVDVARAEYPLQRNGSRSLNPSSVTCDAYSHATTEIKLCDPTSEHEGTTKTLSEDWNAESAGSKDGLFGNGTASKSKSVQEFSRRRVSKTRSRLSSVEPAANSSRHPKQTSLQRKLTPPPQPTQTSINRKTTPPSAKQISTKRKITPPPSQNETQQRNSSDRKMSFGMTRMLVLVTSVFLVTTLPSALYYIIDSYVRDKEVEDTRTNKILNVAQAVTNLLQYANYGSNFILYSARSNRFRLEIRYLLGLANSRFRRHFKSSVLSGTSSARHTTMATRGHRNESSVTPTTTTEPRDEHLVTMTSVNGHAIGGHRDSPPTASTSVTESRNQHLVTTTAVKGHATDGTVNPVKASESGNQNEHVTLVNGPGQLVTASLSHDVHEQSVMTINSHAARSSVKATSVEVHHKSRESHAHVLFKLSGAESLSEDEVRVRLDPTGRPLPLASKESAAEPTSLPGSETPRESYTELSAAASTSAQPMQNGTADISSLKTLHQNDNDSIALESDLTSERGHVNRAFGDIMTLSSHPYDGRSTRFELNPQCIEMCDLADPEALPKRSRSDEDTAVVTSDSTNCPESERMSHKKGCFGFADNSTADVTGPVPAEALNDLDMERRHSNNVTQTSTFSFENEERSSGQATRNEKKTKRFKGSRRFSVSGLKYFARKRKSVYSLENSQSSASSDKLCPDCSAWRHCSANSSSKVEMADFPTRPAIYENQGRRLQSKDMLPTEL